MTCRLGYRLRPGFRSGEGDACATSLGAGGSLIILGVSVSVFKISTAEGFLVFFSVSFPADSSFPGAGCCTDDRRGVSAVRLGGFEDRWGIKGDPPVSTAEVFPLKALSLKREDLGMDTSLGDSVAVLLGGGSPGDDGGIDGAA